MNEIIEKIASTPPAPPSAVPDPKLRELQRGLGAAILNAKRDCCHACDLLIGLRDVLAERLLSAALAPETIEVETSPATPPPARLEH